MLRKWQPPATPEECMKDKLCQHSAKRRGRPRKGEATEGATPVPCHHYNAAMQLQTLLANDRPLRSVLPHLSHEAGQRTLALHPEFTTAFAEYLSSRWGQKPQNRVLVAACADQEHPIRTIRPKELWLLHGVIGNKLGFDRLCMHVLHAQYERNHSTLYVKNENFTEDYLAILSLIAAAQPRSVFARDQVCLNHIRRWTGTRFVLMPPKNYDFSLNEYRAALGARLRRGDMMGMRGEVLEIAQSILLAI
jgi:hypothetical protein